MALKKELLTEVLGAGSDARIGGLPRDASQVLRLMCRDLATPENSLRAPNGGIGAPDEQPGRSVDQCGDRERQ